jgi:hypothetical protein
MRARHGDDAYEIESVVHVRSDRSELELLYRQVV